MSEHDVVTMREVRARFGSAAQMQDAVSRLNLAGFDRASLSLPSGSPGAPLSDEAAPASTSEDAQQMRVLGASTAATVAALAAAGVTVATGGAAAPAVAAAIAAGGVAGGADYAAHAAADRAEQRNRDARAQQGDLVLTVRIMNAAKQAEAEAILRSAGAETIETTE